MSLFGKSKPFSSWAKNIKYIIRLQPVLKTLPMYSIAFNIFLLKMSLSRQNAVHFPYGRTRETLSLFSIFIFMASFQEGEEQRKSWHSMFHDREQEIEEKSLECESEGNFFKENLRRRRYIKLWGDEEYQAASEVIKEEMVHLSG